MQRKTECAEKLLDLIRPDGVYKRKKFPQRPKKNNRTKSLLSYVRRICQIERASWFWDKTKGFSPKSISMKVICIGSIVDYDEIFKEFLKNHLKNKMTECCFMCALLAIFFLIYAFACLCKWVSVLKAWFLALSDSYLSCIFFPLR